MAKLAVTDMVSNQNDVLVELTHRILFAESAIIGTVLALSAGAWQNGFELSGIAGAMTSLVIGSTVFGLVGLLCIAVLSPIVVPINYHLALYFSRLFGRSQF